MNTKTTKNNKTIYFDSIGNRISYKQYNWYFEPYLIIKYPYEGKDHYILLNRDYKPIQCEWIKNTSQSFVDYYNYLQYSFQVNEKELEDFISSFGNDCIGWQYDCYNKNIKLKYFYLYSDSCSPRLSNKHRKLYEYKISKINDMIDNYMV